MLSQMEPSVRSRKPAEKTPHQSSSQISRSSSNHSLPSTASAHHSLSHNQPSLARQSTNLPRGRGRNSVPTQFSSHSSTLNRRQARSPSEPMIYLRGFFPLRGDPEYEQARKVTGDNQPYWFTEERIGGYDTGGYVRQRYDDRLFAGGADMKHPDAGKGKDKDDMKGNGRKRLSASRRVTFAEGIKPNEGQWSMPDLFNFDVEPQRMTRDWSKIFLGADVPKPVQGDEGNTDGMKTQLVTEASIHSLNKSQPQKNDVVTQVQGFPPQHAVFEDKNEGSNEKQGPEDDEDHDADPEDGGEDGDMDAEKVTDEGANLHSSDQIVRN